MNGHWHTLTTSASCSECKWLSGETGSEQAIVRAAKAHAEERNHSIRITRTQGRILQSASAHDAARKAARAKWAAELAS